MSANFSNQAKDANSADASTADPEDSEIVAKAKKAEQAPTVYQFTERDVILYNLGIGATEKDLRWTFEADDNFSAIPTFGVIPQFPAMFGVSLDWLPNWNPVSEPCTGPKCDILLILCHNQAKLLHGEQYLAIKGPIPANGTLVSQPRYAVVLVTSQFPSHCIRAGSSRSWIRAKPLPLLLL
jgi:multifunctional beta-oxidation protein